MSTLLDKLKNHAASGPLPMHMPGHKRNHAAFPWLTALGGGLDITEITGFDNLNAPEGLFRNLEHRAARLWGVDETICLVNGSTVGVLAAVRAALERGGELLMARGSHKSVYHAAELTDATVHYLTPRMDTAFGVWGSVTPEEVANALEAHPEARLVAITSPTYEGVISDVRAIADVCHAHGVPLLVDEAHGAHLGFGGFPVGAVKCGADLVVQSLHKTLPSLTQTAVLHINGGLIDPLDVRRNAAMFQTSSPSYLLSASIDGCVDCLEREGDGLANQWLAALTGFRRDICGLEKLKILDNGGFFALDPSKIVISTAGTDLTGPALMDTLREKYGIELEMAAGDYVIAMTGMGDDEHSVGRLAAALRAIDAVCGTGPAPARRPVVLPERKMSARKALTAPGGYVDLADAVGRISGEYVWAYPPGAPVLVPGEVIDESALDAIFAGHDLHSTRGCVPKRIFCVDQ